MNKYVLYVNKLDYNNVLVSDGIELVVLLVVGIVLCF